MISLPDTATLLPQVHTADNGSNLYLFPSTSTELVKLDLIHEAGSAYQPQRLCAATANRLFTVASEKMSAAEVAEFMDYRGIILEHNPDTLTATTTVYFLRRYVDELLPVLADLLHRPSFPQEDLDVFLRKRKQELQASRLKTSDEARRMYYRALFGEEHPLGQFAVPNDADRLTRDMLLRFYQERYTRMDIVLAGNVDQEVIERVSGLSGESQIAKISALSRPVSTPTGLHSVTIPGAVQTTLRVGRVLPLRWDDPDYAAFMLLTTLLGGYFGSRLMSNLREDKGYTYGISARTQIYRGLVVFFITTDVAAGAAEAAEEEIRRELQRLCDEPVGEEKLQLVKTVMAGDFIRSIDGIFERSERFCSMLSTGVDERLTDNLRQALSSVTAADLHAVARRLLAPDAMIYCRAGA
ncbi:MAG: insulinase family protein [Bacteroidales bacterium]|nr:insulinase family protein [Bacteroidales bacterium]